MLRESWDEAQERRKTGAVLTINVDSNGLGEGISVAADKGRDLAELVDLQKLVRGLRSINLDDVELKAISLRDREDGGGAGVELQGNACCQLTRINRAVVRNSQTKDDAMLLLTSLVKIFPNGAMVTVKPGAGKKCLGGEREGEERESP